MTEGTGQAKPARAILLALALLLPGPSPSVDSPPSPDPAATFADALEAVAEGDCEGVTAQLGPLAGPALPEPLARRVDLLLGICHHRLGRYEEALPHLRAAAAASPEVADYALLAWGEAEQRRGVPQEAIAPLARLLATYPESPLVEPALLLLAESQATALDLHAATLSLRQYLAQFGTSPRAPTGRLLLARVRLRAGDPAEALPLLLELWREEPGSRAGDEAAALLEALGAPVAVTATDLFARARGLYRIEAFSQAVEALVPFATAPGPHREEAQYLLGQSYFRLREYPEAARQLAAAASRGGPHQARALFWAARARTRGGDPAGANTLLQRLVVLRPTHPLADDALFLLAENLEDLGRRQEALEAFARLERTYPDGEFADAALWRRAWTHIRDGRVGQARPLLKTLAGRRASPYATQALFWEGRLLEAAGDREEARQRFQSAAEGAGGDYYAARARELLASHGSPASPDPPRPAAAPVDPPGDHPRLATARELSALRLWDEATEEYWLLVRTHPGDRGLQQEAVEAFLRARRFDRVLWIARRILLTAYRQNPLALPLPAFWELLYPLAYWDAVQELSAARGVDPHLVAAVMREESAFGSAAVSRAGARGLMQLMPATARRVARALALPDPHPEGLHAPTVNLTLGTAYLAQVLEDFGGNLPLALAAYNAGPQAVRRWLQEIPAADPDRFIEAIPYAETREYVKRVLASYHRYQALYAQAPAAPPEPPAAEPGRTPQD
ncbi:MAG TPA: transglycosylase SLT domain-containing protein [Candidatus Methylomirabilis sp.]|nr:transglycosylase SLT domain-containing protein [Candidatus Methylomirabilis sp.]